MGVNFIIGDVTTLQADAVVNVINFEMEDGGSVNHAIHAAAGAELKEYCETTDRCPVGGAKLTPAFNPICLPAILFTPWPHCGGMAENRKKNGWPPAICVLWNWRRGTTAGRLRFLYFLPAIPIFRSARHSRLRMIHAGIALQKKICR